MPSLEDIQKDPPSAEDAIEALSPMHKGSFMRQKNDYKLKMEAVEKIKVELGATMHGGKNRRPAGPR